MDNFDQWWQLLPRKDPDIYVELRNHLENPDDETEISRLFKTSTHRYILSNLLENPYPMCQIVRCLSPPIHMQLYYEALLQFSDFSSDQMSANKSNLYSFLINAILSDEKCQTNIFNIIFQRIDSDEYWELPLVLLASQTMPLLKAYNAYVNQKYQLQPYSKRSAFFMAINKSAHFFELMNQDGHEIAEPDFLSCLSKLTKLATLISNKPTRTRPNFNFYDEVWKQFDQINVANLSDNQKIFYTEFARMLSLHHFVRTNRRYENLSDSIAIKILASKYSILDFFVKFNEGCMIVSTSDYHSVRQQLIENAKFNEFINPSMRGDSAKASEVNIYAHFCTICLMFELLLIKQTTRNYEELVQAKSVEIQQVVDNIVEPAEYIQAIEYLFTLCFLRWEHVSLKVFSSAKLENSTSATTTMYESDTSNDNNDNESLKKTSAKPITRTGFACSFAVLQNMINALSSSLFNRKIDEQPESLKQRFLRISNAIDDARWRLQLIDLYYSATHHIKLPSHLKMILTARKKQMHSPILNSSDETDGNVLSVPVQYSAIRRKARRQHSRKRSSQTRKSDSFANSTEVEGKSKGSRDFSNISEIRSERSRERRGFMSKMFGQIDDMVTISAIRGDLSVAKEIIATNKLSKSSIANEVQLYENFTELKMEMKECLKSLPNFLAIVDLQSSDNEINKVDAEQGLPRITRILEQFLMKRPIRETDETKQLLDRYVSNYPYLELYRGPILQGLIIIDYALSVPDVDTSLNVLKMLAPLWDKPEPIESWQSQIGYYSFIRQITSALTVYNGARTQPIGIQQFLSTQLYPFSSSKLAQKLKQEDTFHKLMQVTQNELLERSSVLEHIANFEILCQKNENLLQHVFSYSMNMKRLINLKKTTETEFSDNSVQQILEIDLFSLIGDIMFDENADVSLDEIEAIVCNLNTNLIHVITQNTCPTISICDKFSRNPKSKLLEIQQLLTKVHEIPSEVDEQPQQNQLRKTFKIKRHEILSYVRQHNELIAYILAKIHDIELTEMNETTELNYILFDNLIQMEEVAIRSDSNDPSDQMLTALRFDSFDLNLTRRFIELKKFRSALQILQYAQERHLKNHETLIESIQDGLIMLILEEENADGGSSDMKTFALIESMNDLSQMSDTLLKYINQISDDELASHLIRTILQHNKVHEVSTEQIEQLKTYLSDISLYANIGKAITMIEYLPSDTWTKIMEINRVAPERLLFSLIERNQYELCCQWIETVSLTSMVMKPDFVNLLMNKISNNRENHNEYFMRVCKKLLKVMIGPTDAKLLLRLKNRKLLEYTVDFLIKNSNDDEQIYQNYKLTLCIFEMIDAKEVNSLWDIVEMPLLIIEQYILNSKFQTLTTILDAIRPLIKNKQCKICSTTNPESGKQTVGDGHNLQTDYKDHAISVQCVDHILRIYAAKALDFRIGSGSVLASEDSPSNDAPSGSESPNEFFIMPIEAPEKTNWIKDVEASHCMCCKKSVFTMLTRRHHCRRCGRVICHTCSTKRLLIPKLYENILVRVCDDCARQTSEAQVISAGSLTSQPIEPITSTTAETYEQPIGRRDGWTYRFNGDFKHDNLLRDEFSFEYAPSASLCLNLISLHTPGQECCDFLLSYCKKFEALLKPLKPGQSNPEVDYTFVTRILYCLSFAAKVHGSSSDCMKVREHAEIINAIVENGCESLLPMESINVNSLRTLRDNLVVAEKFALAIEISLKSGLEKTGIMAAWGIACIKSGKFETAREKFLHCLIRSTCDEDRRLIIQFLTSDDQLVKHHKPIIFKSTARSPKVQSLLSEIICILETTCHPLSSEVLRKTSTASQSSRSLSMMRFTKKEKFPVHEPAVNILNTLSNLKQISHGKYSVKTHRTLGLAGTESMNSLFASDSEQHGLHSRFYTESIYYLVSYGRHLDILHFLIKYKQVAKALKYALFLHVPADQFIETIIVPHLKSGRLNVIIQQMIDMDDTLVLWKEYIIQICLMLEKRNLLNSLYQVQLLLKDTIRASMTCVRFYAKDCVSYQDLRNNVHHLMNAQQHLKSELELCQWEEIKTQHKRPDDAHSLVMKMDPKSLNQHINTIWLQIDASKFLAQCEENGKETVSLIPKISLLPCARVPTLFENSQDKIILVAFVLICGVNVEEGFGLAYRIIQDMNLNADRIYAIVTKYLAVNNRLQDVEKLVSSIKSNRNQPDTKLCDEILSLAVQSALSNNSSPQRNKTIVENLIRLISDTSVQIDCHILSGQLKAAYLLAVQHKRMGDIRRILRYAEKTNQIQIKKLCEKKLQAIDAQESPSSG